MRHRRMVSKKGNALEIISKSVKEQKEELIFYFILAIVSAELC